MPIRLKFDDLGDVDTLLDGYDGFARTVAEKGQQIARGYYSYRPEKVDVTVEQTDKDHCAIVASGDQVSFMEYGTGFYAKGTYEGVLPKQPIVFEYGMTNGWEYYYPSPFKLSILGVKGWIHDGDFYSGHPAMAQMWNTAKDLETWLETDTEKKDNE